MYNFIFDELVRSFTKYSKNGISGSKVLHRCVFFCRRLKDLGSFLQITILSCNKETGNKMVQLDRKTEELLKVVVERDTFWYFRSFVDCSIILL